MASEELVDLSTLTTLSLPQSGPVVRVLLTVIFGAGALFLGGMSVWTTEDSFLLCAPASGGEANCSEHDQYPFQIAFDEPLPAITSASVATRISHDKYGDHPYQVLLLQTQRGEPREFPGIGENGAKAAAVAAGVNAFLSGAGEAQARWHLRESGPPILTAFMFALTFAMLVLIGLAFRRTQLKFDPQEKILQLRVGRFPLPTRRTSAPIAEVSRLGIASKTSRNGTVYRAQLFIGDRPPFELGIASTVQAQTEKRIAAIEAQLAIWRQL